MSNRFYKLRMSARVFGLGGVLFSSALSSSAVAQTASTATAAACQHPAFYKAEVGSDPSLSKFSAKSYSDANSKIFGGVYDKSCTSASLGVADGSKSGSQIVAEQGVEAAKRMLEGSKAGGGLASVNCDGPLSSPTLEANSCEDFSIPIDVAAGKYKFDPSKVKAAKDEFEKLASKAECKMRNAEKAQKALACFEKQYEGLTSAMEVFRADLEEDQKLMNECNSFVTAAVEKEEAKVPQLEQKQKSLRDMMDRMNAVTAAYLGSDLNCEKGKVCGKVADLRNQVKGLKEQENNFVRAQREQAASYISSCFNSDAIQASEPGPFSLCEDEENDRVNSIKCIARLHHDDVLSSRSNSKGQNRSYNDRDKDVAKKERQRLERVLADVMNTLRQTAASDSSLVAMTSTGVSVSQTSSLDTARENAYQILAKEFSPAVAKNFRLQANHCERVAKQNVRTDLTRQGSTLDGLRSELESKKTELNTLAGGMFFDVNKIFREGFAEAFGSQPNDLINIQGCHQIQSTSNSQGGVAVTQTNYNDLNQQADCLDYVAKTMNAMVDGTAPPGSQVPVLMRIPGVEANSSECQAAGRVACECKGFQDCHDVIAKQVIPNINSRITAMKGETSFANASCPYGKCPGMKAVGRSGNEWVKSRMTNAAKGFSAFVEQNKIALEGLKQALRSAGLSAPSIAGLQKGKAFTCTPSGEAGLCALPEDFSGEIAAMAGLPKFNPEVFESRSDEAATKLQEYSTKAAEYAKQAQSIQKFEKACTDNDKAKRDADRFETAKEDIGKAKANCQENITIAAQQNNASPQTLPDVMAAVASLEAVCLEMETDTSKKKCLKLREEFNSNAYVQNCRLYSQMGSMPSRRAMDTRNIASDEPGSAKAVGQ